MFFGDVFFPVCVRYDFFVYCPVYIFLCVLLLFYDGFLSVECFFYGL